MIFLDDLDKIMEGFLNYTHYLNIGSSVCSKGYESIVVGIKTASDSVAAVDEQFGELILQWTYMICTFICLFWFVGGILRFIYVKLRQGALSSVNCWFCSTTTKVPYPQRNSWTCTSCKQYNGFTFDGGYNKRIIAQFIEAVNPPAIPRGLVNPKSPNGHGMNLRSRTGTRAAAENGLCTQCNLNQELKVFQLASFVPTSEAKFDKELEIEKKRLEDLYSLCSTCQNVLNEKLGLVLKNLGNNGNENTQINEKPLISRPLPAEYRLKQNDDTESFKSGNTDISCGTYFTANTYLSGKESQSQGTSSMTMEFSEDPSDNQSAEKFTPITSLTNLKIGSSRTMLRNLKLTSALSCNRRNRNDSTYCYLNDLPAPLNVPLWKDYPTVFNSGNQQFCKPMSHAPSSNYRSSYNYNHYPPNLIHLPPTYDPRPVTHSYGNFHNNSYRSSSIASIFGGGKSCLSPPKLTFASQAFGLNNLHSGIHPTFGLYYQRTSSFESAMNPSTASSAELYFNQFGSNPQLNSASLAAANQMSRSSSQSSGFISGFNTPPPPPLSAHGSRPTSNSSARDNFSCHSFRPGNDF